MAPLPQPLVPLEVSLGGNEWFPLYHRRLLKSRWWRMASDTARSRNVDLWCHAFEDTPAGSLADDDLDLAEAAGFGRDVSTFQALKAEIMAPWTLCADGRWYHPALCEVVLEVWSRTSERRRKDRERQFAHRQHVRRAHTENADVPPLGVTRDSGGESRVTDPEVTHEDALQTDRRDNHSGAEAPLAGGSLKALTGAKRAEPWAADPEFLAVWHESTPKMRQRARSMSNTWKEWVRVRPGQGPGAILAGLRAYLKGDPDVGRTGGPGLQRWLRDRTFEQWTADASPSARWSADEWTVAVEIWKESGSWGASLGPPPGQAGCRVPHMILAQHGLGLRVVNGGAA